MSFRIMVNLIVRLVFKILRIVMSWEDLEDERGIKYMEGKGRRGDGEAILCFLWF